MTSSFTNVVEPRTIIALTDASFKTGAPVSSSWTLDWAWITRTQRSTFYQTVTGADKSIDIGLRSVEKGLSRNDKERRAQGHLHSTQLLREALDFCTPGLASSGQNHDEVSSNVLKWKNASKSGLILVPVTLEILCQE